MVAGLSKPTQTPATSVDEKPTNQASLNSFVVPVLPPAGNVTPWLRAAEAVPASITSCSITMAQHPPNASKNLVRTTVSAR